MLRPTTAAWEYLLRIAQRWVSLKLLPIATAPTVGVTPVHLINVVMASNPAPPVRIRNITTDSVTTGNFSEKKTAVKVR